jgi:hypothetical protein
MSSSRTLFAIEAAALAIWLVLAAALVYRSSQDEGMQPLTSAALKSVSMERWNGIFFQDQHVGYSVSRTSSTDDAGLLMENRSVFQLATFGQVQEIVTASAASTDAEGRLRRFDFFMASGELKLSARGEVKKGLIVMEVVQDGERTKLEFPVQKPPHVGASLESAIRNMDLAIGKEFRIPFFDPVSLSDGEMVLRVVDSEILENGEEAWWIVSSFGDIETRSMVSTTGDILRQEGAMGLSMVRMTPEAARAVPSQDEPVDLISLSAVRLKGRLEDARSKTMLRLEVLGVEGSKLYHGPPLQEVIGNQVLVRVPDVSSFEDVPVGDDSDPRWLESSLSIQTGHPEIVSASKKALEGATTRQEAVRRLNQFVFEHMEKVPSIGVPSGLQSLRMAKGDCNEHTALFVSLARAAGIPSRIAVGLVYSDRVGPQPGFYYHAWPEVLMDGENGWLPLDPTFGQFPADATHIKIAEGELNKQIEIMGVMGRISLKLIEAG